MGRRSDEMHKQSTDNKTDGGAPARHDVAVVPVGRIEADDHVHEEQAVNHDSEHSPTVTHAREHRPEHTRTHTRTNIYTPYAPTHAPPMDRSLDQSPTTTHGKHKQPKVSGGFFPDRFRNIVVPACRCMVVAIRKEQRTWRGGGERSGTANRAGHF